MNKPLPASLLVFAALAPLATASAQPQVQAPPLPPHDEPLLGQARVAPAEPEATPGVFGGFGGRKSAGSRFSVAKGLSVHKPFYLLPLTYSPDYSGQDSELVFQISAKLRLYRGLYFGYTQRSFWSILDSDDSRPFRESDYNPELFYRWIPGSDPDDFWGLDLGIEHESNGQSMPDSRSWNRIYAAPFLVDGPAVYYLKLWYRIPEDDKEDPLDPKGDDNPDIEDYYGYGELRWQRRLGEGHQLATMVRGNPAEAKGALQIEYTLPNRSDLFFYQLYIWHGYGESLLDYNDVVTRVGLGIALTR